MKRFLVIAILLLSVGVIGTNAAPISGRVTDSLGNGVAHVNITAQVIAPCSDTFSAGYITNGFGYYSGTFSPGGCNIVVSASYRDDVFAPSVYIRLFGEDWTGLNFIKQ